MIRALLVFALAVLLAACGEKIQGVPDYGTNQTLPPIEIRWRTRAEIERVYAQNGHTLKEGYGLGGLMGYDQNGKAIIYAPIPTNVNDKATCTLGHEVLHVAWGPYHSNHGEKLK